MNNNNTSEEKEEKVFKPAMNGSPTLSPRPQAVPVVKPFEMGIPEAIIAVANGKAVSRLGWGDTSFYVMMQNNVVKLHKTDNKFYDWVMNREDLDADDWIITNPNYDNNEKN